MEDEEEGGAEIDFQVSEPGNCALWSQPTKQGNMGGGAGWGAEAKVSLGLVDPERKKDVQME